MVEFNDLDHGYDQCVALYNYLTQNGANFAREVANNIDNLTEHWTGTDATLHINNLIDFYNNIVKFIKTSVEVMADTTEKVVQVQETRESNGAQEASVGTNMSKEIDLAGDKADIPGTEKYACVPEARQDYEKLVLITENFKEFTDTIFSDSNELFANWIAGNGREGAVNQFEEFRTGSSKYYNVLTEAKEALGTATSNLEQIMANA